MLGPVWIHSNPFVYVRKRLEAFGSALHICPRVGEGLAFSHRTPPPIAATAREDSRGVEPDSRAIRERRRVDDDKTNRRDRRPAGLGQALPDPAAAWRRGAWARWALAAAAGRLAGVGGGLVSEACPVGGASSSWLRRAF